MNERLQSYLESLVKERNLNDPDEVNSNELNFLVDYFKMANGPVIDEKYLATLKDIEINDKMKNLFVSNEINPDENDPSKSSSSPKVSPNKNNSKGSHQLSPIIFKSPERMSFEKETASGYYFLKIY